MHRHWSLVLFTLLVQSAVGSVWCLQVGHLLGDGRSGVPLIEIHLLVTFCVVVAGQVVAVGHLGRPTAAFHAVRNLRHSWLSREVLAVHLFAGVVAIMVVFALVSPGPLTQWLMLIGSLAGGALLYVMARVYRLRTVVSWNHTGTPLDFLGAALLLGGLQSMLLSNFALDQNTGITGLVAVLAGFMLKVLTAGVNPSQRLNSAGLLTQQPLLQGCGTAFCAISLLSGVSASLQPALLFLAAVNLIAGELVHRARFYCTYRSVGI